MLYIREDIKARVLIHKYPSGESFFVGILLRKKKSLINCSYNPNKINMKNHVKTINRTLDAFSTKYENILLLGDFMAWVDDETMKEFCRSYCLKSLIKQQTCFKNPENQTCINLILTNERRSFHRMTSSVLKMHFRKLPPKVISYRDFKKFEHERFLNSLYLPLNSQNIDYTKIPELFFNICHNELNRHAPRKKKLIRGNNKAFMAKTYCLSLSWKERF